METPQRMPHGTRRGGEEVIGQAVRPSRGWCAHAGAGGWKADRLGAPVVGGSRTAGWKVGRGTGSAPRSWPVCSRRGGGGATWEWGRRAYASWCGAGW